MSAFNGSYVIVSGSPDDIAEKSSKNNNLRTSELNRGIHFFRGRYLVRVANRFELRQKAYEYIYKIYSNKGFTKNGSSNLWLSIYDTLPDTTTFVAKDKDGDIRGALTVVFDSPIGLPSDEIYKEEIDGLRSTGHKISEIISFGIGKPSKDSVKIMAGLVYCAYLLAWRIKKKTDFIISVHPRYEKTYSEKFLFKKLGPVRRYEKVNGAPAILLNLPLTLPNKLKDKKRIFPLSLFKFSDLQEIKIANNLKQMLLPITDEEIYTFFIEKTEVWEEASTQQKEYINQIYPPDKVDHFGVSRVLARGVAKSNQEQNDIQNDKLKAS